MKGATTLEQVSPAEAIKAKERKDKIVRETIIEIVELEEEIERLEKLCGKSQRADAMREEKVFELKRAKEKLTHMRIQELTELNLRLNEAQKRYQECEPGDMLETFTELSDIKSRIDHLEREVSRG